MHADELTIDLLSTAKLDDVLYPRYRLAFKMRKLQQTFMRTCAQHAGREVCAKFYFWLLPYTVDRVDIPLVQETLFATGVEQLAAHGAVSVSRLLSVMSELYESLRRKMQLRHSTVQLQEAHTTCLNWVMTAFEW